VLLIISYNTINTHVKIAIWTDNDLDGAGSALALKYVYKNKAEEIYIREVSDFELVGSIKGWISQNYDSYDLIFITDLFIPDELIEIVDRKKVVIIDHHKSHVDLKDRYKIASTCIKIYPSCTKLIQDKFSRVLDNITQPQEYLFQIIDDYDSYQLKYKESLKLNAVYHSFNKPKVDKFIERFEDGYTEFNIHERNAIKLYFNKLRDQLERAEYYTGSLKGYKVISCVADFGINEVAHNALKKYNADIAFIVIPGTQSISIRKNKDTCSLNLAKLAEILCDGGGHEYAAGGKLTDKFLTFTKTLTHVH
jgi:oligoribonuclease NrnB/cAMP/cGMP phosphodiesterase (DHH superfamily)